MTRILEPIVDGIDGTGGLLAGAMYEWLREGNDNVKLAWKEGLAGAMPADDIFGDARLTSLRGYVGKVTEKAVQEINAKLKPLAHALTAFQELVVARAAVKEAEKRLEEAGSAGSEGDQEKWLSQAAAQACARFAEDAYKGARKAYRRALNEVKSLNV